MIREPDSYFVHIVFRGLFVAAPRNGRIRVLLPDVTRPPSTTVDPGDVLKKGGIREHVGVVEFPVSKWCNREIGAPLVEVNKPAKEPVALFFLGGDPLGGHQIDVSSAHATLRRPDLPEEILALCNQVFPGDNDDLLVLDSHDENGILELANFGGDPSPQPASRVLAGAVEFDKGFVRSERRSRLGNTTYDWVEPDLETIRNNLAAGGDLDALPELPKRRLNLDLRITLVADIGDVVRLELTRQGNVERELLLAPSDPGSDLTVWVKNRELRSILLESDAPDEPLGTSCPQAVVDLDHEVFATLSQAQERLTVPVLVTPGHSDGGCACGGTCPRPGE